MTYLTKYFSRWQRILMTLTSFANNFLWSCCRRHLVGQQRRPFIQFSDCKTLVRTLSLYNVWNLSIYHCRATSGNPQTHSVTIISNIISPLQCSTILRPLIIP